MVNPLDEHRVDELRDTVETGEHPALEDIAGLCATASYWKRKHDQLERAVHADLLPLAA